MKLRLPIVGLILNLVSFQADGAPRVLDWLKGYNPTPTVFQREPDTESCALRTRASLADLSKTCPQSFVAQVALEQEPEFILISPNKETRLQADASAEQILAADYDAQRFTIIMVHGYFQSSDVDWLRKSRDLFGMNTITGQDNLIVMDWAKSASGLYSSVVSRVSAMGAFLAGLIKRLVDELGADRLKVHVIGHSLGAHVAAFAGKRIRPKIGRITGLDAAGPCFGKIYASGQKERISHDDAHQVDLYHYDDLFLGLQGQHGQFDIYINGGHSQPGCKASLKKALDSLMSVLFWREFDMSHTRSTQVASENLAQTSCQQVAYECRDYQSFSRGECGYCNDQNEQCFLMGFAHQYGHIKGTDENSLRTSWPGKRLYISTGKDDLFCAHHYQVLVMFEPSERLVELTKSQKWRLRLQLVNEAGETFKLKVDNQLAPNIYSHLLLANGTKSPIRMTSARLALLKPIGGPVQLEGESLPAPSIQVNFMSNIDSKIRLALSSSLCSTREMLDGGPMVSFTECS